MSSRATRSSARLAGEPPPDPSPTVSTRASNSTRKRKAPDITSSSPLPDTSSPGPQPRPSARRIKRPKVDDSVLESTPPSRSSRRRGAVPDSEMSNTASSSKHPEDTSQNAVTGEGADTDWPKRKAGRAKKALQGGKFHELAVGHMEVADQREENTPSTQTPSRRSKKRPSRKETDLTTKTAGDESAKQTQREAEWPSGLEHSDSNDAESPRDMDDDMSDPFGAGLFGGGRGGPLGMSSTLRALSGIMSGMSSRLRDILNNLRQKDDPSIQLLALEELSNLLLVSNEDNLSGQFSPDPYVKELIILMQPNDITGEENPETMLLACRCIANLMEALRGSVANVVYGGAVPVLCQKLLEIHYIDVAEQALSVSFSPLIICTN